MSAMQNPELIGYLAAAIHAVAPAYLDRPDDSGLANPERLKEALAHLTRDQRTLVLRVLDGMLRERTAGYQARSIDANRP